MKLFQGAAVLAGSFLAASAINFEPSQIQAFVSSALVRYDDYVHYTPPPAASTSAPARALMKVAATEAAVAAATSSCNYWMGQIKHQGVAAFNSNPSSYQVFRNVKDFGAKGDGKTDDTAAIQQAIASGGRCAPGSCASSTVTPAVVFFPPGTYVVSSSLIIYYYTQLIGNPNCMPVIQPTANYSPGAGNIGIFEGDPYGANGLKFGSATNVFYRQIRNFIIDMTNVPASSAVTGIHWPTGQATSIQNVIFKMSKASGTQHQGVFIEDGSGGFMSDLTIEGGKIGLNIGSQQFTVRNVKANDVVTAISQLYSWSWLYQNIQVDNCSVALDISAGGSDGQSVGSVTLIDSSISNTPVGVMTAYTTNSKPLAAGSLILENVDLSNVPVAIQGPSGAVLKGTSHIAAFGQGHKYTPSGPQKFQGSIVANSRPGSLVQSNGAYYTRTKPQYDTVPASSFISARSQGATGNGKTDDTNALQKAINLAKSQGKVLYLDHGDYLVTSTIYIPAGSKVVGEAYSVILSSGKFFNNMASPQPVVQIGKAGEKGSIEWSDTIVSGQGAQAGAIFIQYNLVAPAGTPSGLWDVHTRVGGFAGSKLQLAQCPVTANKVVTASTVNQDCVAAYLNLHIVKGSTGLYLENVWLWTADHDIEDPQVTQITLYSGRGLLDESTNGPVWMIGTSVEHHVKYQYQFSSTKNVFAGFIQTETAYYQPNPPAPGPFPYSATYSDPKFPTTTKTVSNTKIPAANGWGLRISNSSSVLIYGAGHYSFFNNNNVTCSNQGVGALCQSDIVSIEGTNSALSIYTLATVGSHYQITQNGKSGALFSDNFNNFTAVISRFVM